MTATSSLTQLRVIEPCTREWDEMAGNDQTRFCQHCQKSVHNLSAMNASEAEKLVCQSAGSLCVRFEKAADGRMVTLDYQQKPKRRRWIWPLATMAGLAASAGGWFVLSKPKPVPLPVARMGSMVMGGIRPPSQEPATSQPIAACNAPVSLPVPPQ